MSRLIFSSQSTIINPPAYRALALDFSLWSHTRIEIQRAHLEHFGTLLRISRYKSFNWGQRMKKMGIIRRLLFVLLGDGYKGRDTSVDNRNAGTGPLMVSYVVEALGAALMAPGAFGKDDVKAVVAYLAANLHECESPPIDFSIFLIYFPTHSPKHGRYFASFNSQI